MAIGERKFHVLIYASLLFTEVEKPGQSVIKMLMITDSEDGYFLLKGFTMRV